MKVSYYRFYWMSIALVLFGFRQPKNDLKITYLANCGYLYESDMEKVIIDPFGTEFGNFFYLPSAKTRTDIVQGNKPFENIDLLLITHIHGDHFNALLAEKFLLMNPKTKMICPPQVYKQMRDSCIDIARINSQIISPKIDINASKKITVNGIKIMAIRMQHGTDRSLEGIDSKDYTEYEKTENFGYVINIENHNIFHQGDACLKINREALKRINRPVDIAYLSYFDWDSISLNILKEEIKAKSVIFMHGTKPGKELSTEQFQRIKPQLVFINQELESKIFN